MVSINYRPQTFEWKCKYINTKNATMHMLAGLEYYMQALFSYALSLCPLWGPKILSPVEAFEYIDVRVLNASLFI